MRYVLLVLVFIAGSLTGAVTARADEFTPESDVNDYIASAERNNPALEAAFLQWKAAAERTAQADALPNPKLTYSYYIEHVETRVGPQEQKFGFSQAFPWFGILGLKSEAASDRALAARYEFEKERLNLRREVSTAFHDYFYLGQSIRVTRENLNLLRQLEGVAQSVHSSGGPLSSVLRLQVEIAKLEERLASLADMRNPLAAHLNSVLNREIDAPLPWPAEPDRTDIQLDENEAMQQLEQANPELLRLDALISSAEKDSSIAHKESLPSFSLGVEYISTGDALMAGTPDSGKDPVIAMATLDIPLWRGKYRAAVREADYRREAQEMTRESREQQIRAQLTSAFFSYRDAGRKIELFGNTLVTQARQAMELAEESYRTGKADLQGLIDAQRQLLEFELMYARAQADKAVAAARIRELIGFEKPTGTGGTINE
ncbi:MAG: TolC family protein [Verrucomicrobia bacterium]|nr:TolC family protein [Verrucomicrobiota bacterium]